MFKTLEELNQDFSLNFLAEHPELAVFDTDDDSFEDYSLMPEFRSQLNNGVTSEDSALTEIPRESPQRRLTDISVFDTEPVVKDGTPFESDAFSEGLALISDESDRKKKKDASYQFRIKRSKTVVIVSNVVFYAAIIGLIICAAAFHFNGPKPLFGHYLFNVETNSMQSVYPVGSLVIVQETDTDTLKVADDISFKRSSDGAIITHRIIQIFENYQGTSSRAFEVKGLDNPYPDPERVLAGNVLGKVVGSIGALGGIAAFIGGNIVLILIIYAVVVAAAFFVRWYFGMSKDERKKRLRPKKIKVDLYRE